MTADKGHARAGSDIRRSKPERNDLLRQARLRKRSPNDPGRPMSQRELAEAVTAYIFGTTDRTVVLDRHDISRWERGQRHCQTADYREAIRAVLGVTTDAELGFPVQPRTACPRPPPVPSNSTADTPSIQPIGTDGPAAQLVTSPGAVDDRSLSPGGRPLKIETIRFASRTEDEAFFYRTVHHLAAGCLLLDAKDSAVTALLAVVSEAVGERQRQQQPMSG